MSHRHAIASLEVHGAKFAHHRIMSEAETQNCRKPGASHHIITPFRAPLPSPRSLEPMARLTLVLDEDHIQFLSDKPTLSHLLRPSLDCSIVISHLRIERMKKDCRACHWSPWLQTIGSCNLNVRFTITRAK